MPFFKLGFLNKRYNSLKTGFRMIRRVFKRSRFNERFHHLIVKYKIPPSLLSINRRAVSKGVMIGLFVAFIPMPLQMIPILMMRFIVRFNVPIAIAMILITNPLTMPFVYLAEYKTGAFILGSELQPVELTLEWFQNNIDDIAAPLYAGTLVFSTVISLSAYFLIQLLWIQSVKRHRNADLQEQKELHTESKETV